MHPVSPRAVEGLYATGHWLLGQSKPQDAAAVFRAMVLVAPGDERSWLGLAACHEEVGQDDVAARIYATGTEVTSSGLCCLGRARALQRLGQAEEAAEAFAAAAERGAS